jgi:hypothetical protein
VVQAAGSILAFFMITSPADRCLAFTEAEPAPRRFVRACAGGAVPISPVECRVDDGAMTAKAPTRPPSGPLFMGGSMLGARPRPGDRRVDVRRTGLAPGDHQENLRPGQHVPAQPQRDTGRLIRLWPTGQCRTYQFVDNVRCHRRLGRSTRADGPAADTNPVNVAIRLRGRKLEQIQGCVNRIDAS